MVCFLMRNGRRDLKGSRTYCGVIGVSKTRRHFSSNKHGGISAGDFRLYIQPIPIRAISLSVLALNGLTSHLAHIELETSVLSVSIESQSIRCEHRGVPFFTSTLSFNMIVVSMQQASHDIRHRIRLERRILDLLQPERLVCADTLERTRQHEVKERGSRTNMRAR
jgi:predicted protein tyrosine phosphatase